MLSGFAHRKLWNFNSHMSYVLFWTITVCVCVSQLLWHSAWLWPHLATSQGHILRCRYLHFNLMLGCCGRLWNGNWYFGPYMYMLLVVQSSFLAPCSADGTILSLSCLLLALVTVVRKSSFCALLHAHAFVPFCFFHRKGTAVFVEYMYLIVKFLWNQWMLFFLCVSVEGRVRHAHLHNDRDGKPKGTAVVEFDSPRDAQKCIGKCGFFVPSAATAAATKEIMKLQEILPNRKWRLHVLLPVHCLAVHGFAFLIKAQEKKIEILCRKDNVQGLYVLN